ncbi:MAG: 3-hydroxybenzoate 6-monooxygenase [Pseudomonadota bacterium]
MNSLDSSSNKVLIAGAGVGGLSSALALARRGYQVVVLERSSRLEEFGAGIQLGPNAFNALEALGIGQDALAKAIYVDRLRLMNAMSAEEVMTLDLGVEFRQRFRNPYAVIHRGDLYRVLLNACAKHPEIEIRTGCEFLSYQQTRTHVLVQLSNRQSVGGCALIGADGIWSRVRKQLIGDERPRVPGHTTFRSVIPIEEMPEELRWNDATLWAGDKCHVVHYPLSDNALFNFAITSHTGATEPVSGDPVHVSEVEKTFSHVHPKVRHIIKHGRDWRRWVLFDRDPTHEWVQQRVALLGDAAHPTLQYLAQGACMAIEDAVCLGDAFAHFGDDIESALLAYRDLRASRTAQVVLKSRAMGEHVYHPSGTRAKMRDAFLQTKSSSELFHEFAWLYDGGRESQRFFQN